MLPYWLLFAYFAAGALLGGSQRAPGRRVSPLLVAGTLAIALMIGLRYNVGGDWNTYDEMFRFTRFQSFESALEIGDPGYQFISWIAVQLGAGIWLVNLVCGLIFAWGLLRFTLAQNEQWLSIVIAIPYMVIVMAMGYTRQAVALGILMAGMAAVKRGGSIVRFAVSAAAAALFHKSAVVAFPLIALSKRRNKLLNFLIAAATGFLLYDLFLQDSMEGFVNAYIGTAYSSQGAAIRVVMNLVPAAIFFLFAGRLALAPEEQALWRNFSLAAMAMLVLLAISPSSTAVDRISLYLMPLQIAILSRLPMLFRSAWQGRLVVVIYSGLVQFVWLNFAQHSKYWLPYRFYLF